MNVPLARQFRVGILEDHSLFAESLEVALELEGYEVTRFPVPSDGHSPGALVSKVLRSRPDVVLLDLDLGGFGSGMRLIAPLARAGTAVVVVTAETDPGELGQCLLHGARKVLSKSKPLHEVRAVVRRLHHGLPVMDVEEREELLEAFRAQCAEREQLRGRFDRLTTRERAVLGRLMAGHPVRDIATENVVSEATVRSQVKAVLAKLEVTSQLAAVGLAHRIGWRSPEQP